MILNRTAIQQPMPSLTERVIPITESDDGLTIAMKYTTKMITRIPPIIAPVPDFLAKEMVVARNNMAMIKGVIFARGAIVYNAVLPLKSPPNAMSNAL